jgi:hypothetical protein
VSHYAAERLYALLPAVYRQRDAELGYPLRDLVAVLAGQAEVVERDVARLYENWFIETCDEWVVPYIGDLIGVRGTPPGGFSQRAEVAGTIGYRRRKGTAAMLEQLARDVTGWPARVVEYFELLATTQYLNHLRPHNLRTPDLRRADPLELLGGPFETAAHTAEVRRIPRRRGRYNIPNVGIFLWRLAAYPLSGVRAAAADATGLRYTFNVLGPREDVPGLDEPLFHHPVTETSPLHIAEEVNVPAPIRRRALHAHPEIEYGKGLSFLIEAKGLISGKPNDFRDVAAAEVIACDLTGWQRQPSDNEVAVDPVLGRIAFGQHLQPTEVRVSYHYGFSADLGGGEYERQASFTEVAGEVPIQVGTDSGAGQKATLSEALDAWGGNGSAVIEIQDSRTYREAIGILTVPKDARLEIRGRNGARPALLLEADLRINGEENSEVELNGLLIADRSVRLRGLLERVKVQHCTLVPARNLGEDKRHLPSLFVRAGRAELTIERSILGTIRTEPEVRVVLRDSILDATPPEKAEIEPHAAFGGIGGGEGGPLHISCCTVIGSIETRELTLAENSIFLNPVTAERRQGGCVRFCWVHPDSRVPRRFHCQPEGPCGPSPRFISLRYGHPGYCQLALDVSDAIRRGADDESEMGVFSSLLHPQREDYLRMRLDEYLRAGLEAGIFYVT